MTRAVALCSLLALSAFAAEKPRVAVLYFDINSTDADHQVLKKGLCEMLITDLSVDPALTVVERNRLEEVVAELNLQHTSKVDQSTAQQLGKLLGAQYLVTGSVNVLKTSGRLDAKVITVQTGVVTGAMQPLKDGDVFEAESKLADKLNAMLAKADAHDPPQPKKQQGKLTLDNAVKYSQALDAIDKKDKKAAKDKLQQVVKAQPDFMLASLELDRLMK
jgi:TolB-like protein